MELSISEKKGIREFIKTNKYQNKKFTQEEIASMLDEVTSTNNLQTKKKSLIEFFVRYVHKTKDNEIFRINIGKTNSDIKEIINTLTEKEDCNETHEIVKDDLSEDSIDIYDMSDSEEDVNDDERPNYNFPNDGKYEVKRRKDVFNGPYGTDWIHDKQKDDEWNAVEKKRAKIYTKLRKIKLPEQRTPEWFEMRSKKITASDGGAIVGYNKYEKAFWFVKKKTTKIPFESNSACYHGKKLEEPATMIYQYRMNVKVEEFGLMGHPNIAFLGASPDGIVCHDKLDGIHKTKFVGRMLEIKCPARRKIKLYSDDEFEVCPKYYWAQVQLQLQCCELDECDFWQCKLDEYDCFEHFLNDTDEKEPFRSKATGYEKGCLIQLLPQQSFDRLKPVANRINELEKQIRRLKDPDTSEFKSMKTRPREELVDSLELKLGDSKKEYDTFYWQEVYDVASFIYPKTIEMSPFDCLKWINEQLEEIKTNPIYRDKVFDCVKYWRLVESKNITIKRNDSWFEEHLPIYERTWGYVEFLKNNPKQNDIFHRAIQKYDRNSAKGNTVAFKLLKELCDTKRKGYKKWLKQLDEETPEIDPENLPKDWYTRYYESKEKRRLEEEQAIKEKEESGLDSFAF